MSRDSRIRRLLAHHDEGVSTLEVVIVFPALMLIVFFTMYVARYHYATQVTLAAAEEGARVAAATNDPSQGVAAAENYVKNAGGGWMTGVVAVSGTGTPGLGQFSITVTDHVAPLVSLAVGGTSSPLALDATETSVSTPEIFSHG